MIETILPLVIFVPIAAFAAYCAYDYTRRRSLPGLPSRGKCPDCEKLRFAHLRRCPHCGSGVSIDSRYSDPRD